MSRKLIFHIVYLTIFISCSSSKKGINKQGTNQYGKSINGVITTTDYRIPIPCSIEIYHKKNIFSTTSNREGEFSLTVESKYINRNLFACVTPLENSVLKDTIFHEYYEVGAECMFHNPGKGFITDTVYFSINEDTYSLDWNIKGCVAYPYGKNEED